MVPQFQLRLRILANLYNKDKIETHLTFSQPLHLSTQQPKKRRGLIYQYSLFVADIHESKAYLSEREGAGDISLKY